MIKKCLILSIAFLLWAGISLIIAIIIFGLGLVTGLAKTEVFLIITWFLIFSIPFLIMKRLLKKRLHKKIKIILPKKSKFLITSLFLFTILVVYLGLNLYSKSDKNPLPTNDYKNEPLKHNVSADEVFDLVNQEREKIGLKPLKRNTKLDEAAMMRAQDILATDDWSHEAPHSELTYQVALNKVKYYNTTKGENLAEGQWTSQNTVNSWMNSETHKDNILNSNYQDTGVATFSGTLNNNQTIITVQLFGGYIPPNYKQTDIESWEKSLNRLREILPSWENIRNSPNRYPNNKAKAERLIQIINTRISRIQAIASKMRGNQWLTNEETKYTNEDQGLYNEQEQLGNYLNSQQW